MQCRTENTAVCIVGNDEVLYMEDGCIVGNNAVRYRTYCCIVGIMQCIIGNTAT